MEGAVAGHDLRVVTAVVDGMDAPGGNYRPGCAASAVPSRTRRVTQWTRSGCGNGCTSNCCTDSASSARSTGRGRGGLDRGPGRKRGDLTGSNPVDGGKPGTKTYVLCDRRGKWLNVLISAANTHDSHLLLPLLDSIAQIRSPRGRPRHRPAKLHADKATDQPAPRTEVRRRGIAVRIARKGIESSQRLGRHRWIVESCLSWLLRNHRLIRRYNRTPEHFLALADIGCLLIRYGNVSISVFGPVV